MFALCPECKNHYEDQADKPECPHQTFQPTPIRSHITLTGEAWRARRSPASRVRDAAGSPLPADAGLGPRTHPNTQRRNGGW